MIFELFGILFLYIISIVLLIFGFFRIKKIKKTDLKPKTSFTIIVPFRNEKENLPILLESFSNLNYPKELLKVILVDDNSDEKFHISHFAFHISQIDNIRISNSPKKMQLQPQCKM
ncbi:glycosyltransferase [Flavobacterium sp. P21]|uniref:glycosyltransferase n=1 Tax=Flavobacterium sp. P21 TaxID=3423948 RepID=UPI003D67C555